VTIFNQNGDGSTPAMTALCERYVREATGVENYILTADEDDESPLRLGWDVLHGMILDAEIIRRWLAGEIVVGSVDEDGEISWSEVRP
jgi:hypothetical protein